MKPIRIKRKRMKNWKNPSNTVYVGRPSRWGNDYSLIHRTPEEVVELYKRDLTAKDKREIKKELKGKNLMCWCPLTYPNGYRVLCHADVLLEIANSE